MTGSDRDRAFASDPYLTRQDVGGGATTWAPTGERMEPVSGGRWENWAVFAAVVLLITGLGHVLVGLVALFDASYYDAAESDPALNIGYSAWGWIQLLGGAFLLAAGGALLARKEWARIVAVVVSVLNALGALAFLPTAPVWGLLLVGLNVLIVYALTVHAAET
jgi:hypothetical protein